MTATTEAPLVFDNTFVRDLEGLFVRWQPAPAPAPELLVLNDGLAEQLGIDPAWLRSDEGVAVLSGNVVPDGAEPVATAYAGHQFGGYSPRLGDGRALLLGELLDVHGRRRDLHLKGSGRTPFARGGDGKAVVGPMLREHLIGEAMYALGVPTTRALAVVATGEEVIRDRALPGAVLARVAASHVRVGTFQFAATTGDTGLVRRLADHVIARHHPAAASSDQPYLSLFEAVVEAQASLVARWMLLGFIHGVMNTDNTTVSGETIDYGPCAFMDGFEPATVFSSIDHGGRYAYAQQPPILMWNLARFAETLLPLLATTTDEAVEAATAILQTFPHRYRHHWTTGMRAKLGLRTEHAADQELFEGLLQAMHAERVDHTSLYRALSTVVRGDHDRDRARRLFTDPSAFDGWAARWTARLDGEGALPEEVASSMDSVNPVYIPRNHLVEDALTAATAGHLGPYERLLDMVTHPFTERPGAERFASPAPADFGRYVTFCGT